MGVFSVTKLSEGPVRPSADTPSETLPLAWVDRYPTHRGLVESTHVYRAAAVPQLPAALDQGEDDATETRTKLPKKSPAAVVRGALADALVHYYPFAGRIVEGDVAGRPAVLCSGEGVYFVEAAANCTLADVNYLERPLLLAKEQLVPYPTEDLWPVEPHNSLAMIQVRKDAFFFRSSCALHHRVCCCCCSFSCVLARLVVGYQTSVSIEKLLN